MRTALTAIPTPSLERLLRLVHAGKVACPLTAPALHLAALIDVAEHGHLLRGLDQRGVEAVLLAVIAERRAR